MVTSCTRQDQRAGRGQARSGKLDLHGTVITADALHTVKTTAELTYQRDGKFVLPV
jgi:hypothetical protein